MAQRNQTVRSHGDPQPRSIRNSRGGPGFMAHAFVTEEMEAEIPEPWQVTVPCGLGVVNVVLHGDCEFTGSGIVYFSLRSVINPSTDAIAVGEHFNERFKYNLPFSGAFPYTFQYPMMVERIEPVTFQIHPLMEGGINITKLRVQLTVEVSGLFDVDQTLADPRFDPAAEIVSRQPFKIQLLNEIE